MPDLPTNVLYWGDNLPILRNRDYFPDESVDLVYLDPPFNSNASYNVLFKEPTGELSSAQLQAFSDTWHWDQAAQDTWAGLHATAPRRVQDTLDAFQKILIAEEGRFARNDMMAYLVMMTARLLELHRVLKGTGSLYLHCDPTASHYLKVILDTIFGPTSFRNEIVWRRSHPKGHAFTRFARNHDITLAYSKTPHGTVWNPQYRPYDPDKASKQYALKDEGGRPYQLTSLLNPNKNRPNLTYEYKGVTRVWRWTKERMLEEEAKGRIVVPKGGKGIPRYKRYLDEQEGIPVDDVWFDIEFASGGERTGYETQKPLALLERIIGASSNEGDVVLDPFCGCGTAILAAHRLNRRWIGIDVTNLAITVMKARLAEAFPGIRYRVIGEPTTLSEARALAAQEPEGRYQFQWWALGLINALPASDRKKGADAGVDGFFSVHHDNRGTFTRVIVQVKSGHVTASHIRDLRGTIGDHNLGIFITLEEPTEPMKAEAAKAGLYENPLMERHYPRIQILTIQQLLNGQKPNLPPRVQGPRGPVIGQQVHQGVLPDQGYAS